MTDDRLDALLRMVRQSTVSSREVNLEQELYYELRISGDDLYDLLSQIAEEFGTDFSELDLRHYAPGEGAAMLKPALVAAGLRPYESLTVRDLWTAIKSGRWQSR
jgi:hypothetical protein